jgi:hypothetical protein
MKISGVDFSAAAVVRQKRRSRRRLEPPWQELLPPPGVSLKFFIYFIIDVGAK